MSRITKQIAEDVSRAMTAAERSNEEQLKANFQTLVLNAAFNRVPKAVKALYEHSDIRPYISTVQNLRLSGTGFNMKYMYTDEPIPGIHDKTLVVQLTDDEADELFKMENAYKEAEKKTKQLQLEIQVALYETLRTYKKVEEFFPEAYQHLPKLFGVTALSINLDALRQKISK